MASFPLNKAQQDAVDAPAGPLLIVAGAGTGKTRTLTSRILHLVSLGVPPERICAITFTNKAAKEMADRVMIGISQDDHLKLLKQRPLVGTFHSLGARILRKECGQFDRKPNFTIFDDHDSFDVLKKVLKPEVGASHDEPAPKKKETSVHFMNYISRSKNLGPQTDESANPNAPKPSHVFGRYEQSLKENNAFDFDDLVEKVVALFKSQPATLLKYQNKFDVILVDEYQDINPIQHQFIKLLAARHKNITVVGDDEQTIYGWRYADISIFLNFEREWPGARVTFLEENYRSTESIIRAASTVVQNNRIRAPKKLFTNNPTGDPIVLYEAWGENEEAAWIAHSIQGQRGSDPKKDIAILYRTNAQSRAIEQALIRRDIPYRIFGGLKFYERREVKDVVSGLRFAANPSDAVAAGRLEKNLTKRKFAAFKLALSGLSFSGTKPVDIIQLFLEKFDYFDYLRGDFTNADERIDNVSELISFASSFESLDELLEKLSLLQSTDDEQSNGDLFASGISAHPVTLMTVHMAKGLEFDSVFLAGVSEGLFPHSRSMDKELQIEEERRLMYVAMTRARKNLFLSFYGMPSRFLGEIPPDCITLVTADSAVDRYDDDETIISMD